MGIRLRERAPVVGGGMLGAILGYLAFRHAGPWTFREGLVLALGSAMVGAVGFAATLRRR